ncbi:histidine kinase [Longispora sp. K20-0274]|uniref:sensor histidine kinase n=1 Tax=Longispora sp. K20-0274 TaxID=3088255 RepID=UPI00399A7BB1
MTLGPATLTPAGGLRRVAGLPGGARRAGQFPSRRRRVAEILGRVRRLAGRLPRPGGPFRGVPGGSRLRTARLFPGGGLRWLVDLALVAVAVADVQLTAPPTGHPSYACSLLSAGALLLRRRWPRTTLLLVLPGLYDGVAVLAAVFALYGVATVERRRPWLYAATAVVALGAILPWPLAELATQRPDELARSVIYGVLTACAPAALGLAVRTRADLADRLAELAERRAREREWTTQRVLAAERARLAREMHDVVSHQVSLIAVTAGAWRVGAADDASREAAEEIRRRAAQTLVELRHMVGVLRACPAGPGRQEGPPAPPGPDLAAPGLVALSAPGLAELPALVAEQGGAVFVGLPHAGAVPEALQRAVYRTVQEALTNVRKHAPGTATTVSVSRSGGELRAEIVNTAPRGTGPGSPAAGHPLPGAGPGLTGGGPGLPGDGHGLTGDGHGLPGGGHGLPGGGHGLLGLRERAALLGGRLVAGPTDDGFAVRLTLPLTDLPG